MTPETYLRRLEQLVTEVRDQDAVDFAARYQPAVRPPLTFEQLDYVGGMLEGAAMAVAMLDADSQEPEAAGDSVASEVAPVGGARSARRD